MRNYAKMFGLAVMICLSMVVTSFSVFATSLEDNVGQSGSGSAVGDFLGGGELSEDDAALGNWISGQRGMTSSNLETASKTLSPLTNIAGNIVGGIVVFVFAGVFVITALDLFYIAFPPIRNVLYKGGGAGGMAAPGGGMPMGGGMMGGFGRRGMMGGGMMGGGMMGGNPEMAAESRPIQWISDEAIQCAALLNNGGAAQTPMGGNPMMGGQMAMQGSGANMSMKSVIGTYFKKRFFFMIMLAVCAIVLTSSVLLGTGVNLAQWMIKIMSSVNNNIPK